MPLSIPEDLLACQIEQLSVTGLYTSVCQLGTLGASNICRVTLQDKPMGHANCLKGQTFVITGTLDSLYRNEAEDYIKRHSGRVTGSVSGKTSFLLVGENSGNSKVNQVSLQPLWFAACLRQQ